MVATVVVGVVLAVVLINCVVETVVVVVAVVKLVLGQLLPTKTAPIMLPCTRHLIVYRPGKPNWKLNFELGVKMPELNRGVPVPKVTFIDVTECDAESWFSTNVTVVPMRTHSGLAVDAFCRPHEITAVGPG